MLLINLQTQFSQAANQSQSTSVSPLGFGFIVALVSQILSWLVPVSLVKMSEFLNHLQQTDIQGALTVN